MLVGTVGGGLLGQIDLSLPYLVRSGLLAAVFVVAFVVMHDVGFTPRRVTVGELPGEVARNARAGVEFGWRQRSLRLLMLAGAAQSAFLMWGFYASQPYLLGLLDSDAVWVAGLVAAGVALATIVGNQVVRVRVALLRPENDAPPRRGRGRDVRGDQHGAHRLLLGGASCAAPRHGCNGCDGSRPLRLPPPGGAVVAACDRRVLRLDAVECGRYRRPARARRARRGALGRLGVRRGRRGDSGRTSRCSAGCAGSVARRT